ncbi:MAG: PLATZ transcription factor family protein [Chloroflexota bacterium]|nr:PLATZ transcription factor family protein [Chloroflexota bacterium]
MSYAARAARLLAERRGLTPFPESAPSAAPETGCEVSEECEESPTSGVVWWPDPTLRQLPDGADGWNMGVREAFAPILHFPPPGCVGPVACARLGPCDRHAAGAPCRVADTTGSPSSGDGATNRCAGCGRALPSPGRRYCSPCLGVAS